MRRQHRFHGLFRPKLRQTWNKYNFYNIARGAAEEPQVTAGRATFFQQKWKAKAKTRAYHGDHVNEKKWVRLFDPRLRSAVEMPPKYLAEYDGSEQALGTGSGLSGAEQPSASSYSRAPVPSRQKNIYGAALYKPPRFADGNALLNEPLSGITPHVQMTFAPLERRLDTAIFRALFASSVRQARQFCVHGAVKVNGKKMVYPAYQLNPGDMFQVEVEKVLFATGKTKKAKQAEALAAKMKNKEEQWEKMQARREAQEGESEEAEATTEARELTPEETWQHNNKMMKYILADVKQVLKDASERKKQLGPRDKIALRVFRAQAKRFISHPDGGNISAKEIVDAVALQMKEHDSMRATFEKFQIADEAEEAEAESSEGADGSEGAETSRAAKSAETAEAAEAQPKEKVHVSDPRAVSKAFADLSESQKAKAERIIAETKLTSEELRNLSRILAQEERNPMDETKPYYTPWQPRQYMSAFAFIPRYLEVNPKICSAVYLRHPVARKGFAEVPTPFNYLTSQLAHGYYLERG